MVGSGSLSVGRTHYHYRRLDQESKVGTGSYQGRDEGCVVGNFTLDLVREETSVASSGVPGGGRSGGEGGRRRRCHRKSVRLEVYTVGGGRNPEGLRQGSEGLERVPSARDG